MCSYFPRALWMFLTHLKYSITLSTANNNWIPRELTPEASLKECHHPHMPFIHEKSHTHVRKQMSLRCWICRKHLYIHGINSSPNGSSDLRPPAHTQHVRRDAGQTTHCVSGLLVPRQSFGIATYLYPTGPEDCTDLSSKACFILFSKKKIQPDIT